MQILFFGHLKTITGCASLNTPVAQPVNADGLWQKLIAEHPVLGKFRNSVRLARNSEYVDAHALFADADEVALIPPVSGG